MDILTITAHTTTE